MWCHKYIPCSGFRKYLTKTNSSLEITNKIRPDTIECHLALSNQQHEISKVTITKLSIAELDY